MKLNNTIFKNSLNKLHRLTERDSRLAHYFATILEFGASLRYFATPGTKYDVIFFLHDPNFLIR